MAEKQLTKQLIVVVEGTAAMGPHWQTIVTEYLDKIIKSFCGYDATGQKPSVPVPVVEFSLVMFNARGNYSACLVQRSGWTRDVENFLNWLSAISFSGGGFSDVAIAEGLAEALMMCTPSNWKQPHPNVDKQRHCILVAASNPFPLPTPVFRPQIPKLEQSESTESQKESRLSDAEALAKFFPQLNVSLSVISPKQLPKLKAIYNAGKRNPRAADLPLDNVKSPYHLVLLSENFIEARAALSRNGIANLVSNHSPMKVDTTSVMKVDTAPVLPVSVSPPISLPSANVSVVSRQPIIVGNVTPATVKIEPTTVTSMVSGPGYTHVSSVPRAALQGVPALQTSSPLSAPQEMIPTTETVQDLKPMVTGLTQSLRPMGPAAANVSILNNLSQARQVMNSAALAGGTSIGLQSMGGTHMAMHMSNMISSGMVSSVPPTQTVLSPGQPGMTSMAASGQPGITSMAGTGTLAGNPQVALNSNPGSFASASSNLSGNSSLVMSQPMVNSQGVSIGQPVPVVSQGNISSTQMMQNGIGMNQNMISGVGQSGISSANSTMMPTPGMGQQGQPGPQSLGMANNAAANMPLPSQTSNAMQSAQSKYVRVWEGNLSGQRQGQPVFITRLEGYRSASASETLAANWPSTMQIVRLISQDHMNNKQYVGKADFLVFRAMNQHGFLGQLQEKKLCAVIQLPSQTLLLSVSDKACRLIGMLFPGISNQQQHQQLQPQQQHPQLQHQQQLQQLQQQPLPQLQQQQQIPQQIPQLQQQQQIPQLQQQQQIPQQQQQIPQLQQQQQQQQQQISQIQQQQQIPQMQPQQQQQQQAPQMQQHIPQMQQQPSQQQQMVGTGMGQAYVQGQGRSQMVSQGQVTSQGPTMSGGGGYLS
ncbi:mediator of RNA polymerase II transcription subunit 25 isoform X3 [Apium graveolens]|uniref:mediator of RNA polymerase II transcription subunit 25 isoform X3 n=1 Tax=Apium graveolens TaxID=4045 RepID=UPI003D7A3385